MMANLKGLAWPKLISGTLVKRYKRFLADVKLNNNRVVTAHCANSGSMKECSEPGRTVFLSTHDNPKRRLKYTWEIIEMPSSLVGVNTNVPNRLVYKSIEDGLVKELEGYDRIKPEVKVGNHSRLDFCLTKRNNDQCFVEVKNCTLVTDGVACFPDAVTSRGLKHLVELQKLLDQGKRCVMFYLIQRNDAGVFKPADHIDPQYGKELRKALKKGVEILVYDTAIDLERIVLNKKIPYRL
jgi:sugar fermentation stimulation protein A